uniref:Uncharacterized protein n=1 Tax=Physcomitrium patens TaxID=3218 RepID=A0A2K1JRS0_PHYPA|nr:hypothetical protein PHYPA_016611 [Physcomitrium patens]
MIHFSYRHFLCWLVPSPRFKLVDSCDAVHGSILFFCGQGKLAQGAWWVNLTIATTLVIDEEGFKLYDWGSRKSSVVPSLIHLDHSAL